MLITTPIQFEGKCFRFQQWCWWDWLRFEWGELDEAEPHDSDDKSCQEIITAADVNVWECFRFLVGRDLFIFVCQVVSIFILVFLLYKIGKFGSRIEL